MKTITTNLVLLASLIFCTVVRADYYLGLDIKHRYMPGNDKHAYKFRNSFPDKFTGGEIYLGNYFEENISSEIGYEDSTKRTNTYTFTQGETFVGNPKNAGDSVTIDYRMRSLNIHFNGYIDFKSSIFLLGQVGIAVTRSTSEGSFLSNGGGRTNLHIKDKWGVVPRIGVGLQYKLYKKFEIRGMARYEAASLMQTTLNDEQLTPFKVNPYTHTFSMAIGVIYPLWT